MITEISVVSLAPHSLHQIEWIVYSNGMARPFWARVSDLALYSRAIVSDSAAVLRMRRDMGVSP